MLTSTVRVPESDVESFVGSAALGRARGYANATRIRDVAYDAATHRLTANVKGSGAAGSGRWYSTAVHLTAPAADGSTRPLRSMCSCPVGLNCKHAAALMLFVSAQASQDESIPAWRRQAEDLSLIHI